MSINWTRGRRAHTVYALTTEVQCILFTEKCIIYSCNRETRDEEEKRIFLLFCSLFLARLHIECLAYFLCLFFVFYCLINVSTTEQRYYRLHSVFTKYVIHNKMFTIGFFFRSQHKHTLTRKGQWFRQDVDLCFARKYFDFHRFFILSHIKVSWQQSFYGRLAQFDRARLQCQTSNESFLFPFRLTAIKFREHCTGRGMPLIAITNSNEHTWHFWSGFVPYFALENIRKV